MSAKKLSAWAAKRTGTLNKFYTRDEVGDALTSELGIPSPRTAIDLGAGEGSLSAAVVRRWPDAALMTIDLDSSCIENLHKRLVGEGAASHEHLVLDVFDADLPEKISKPPFDLAICNPPFFKPKWQERFDFIMSEAGLQDALAAPTETSAEVLFFAQNIRLVAEGGTVALIVPDGIATAWRARQFRQALIERYRLETVIQLPPDSFADTEARCFVLIIKKVMPAEGQLTKLLRLNEDGSLSDPVWVDCYAAVSRLDFTYHASRETTSPTSTLRTLGAEIRRGSLNSVQRRQAEIPVFHTGDFPAPGGVVDGSDEPPECSEKLVVAEVGDILIARVDRELHEKVAIVATGAIAITDCIYRVRLDPEHRDRVFQALSSEAGRARLFAATKGVGPRLLGKGDLMDIPLCLAT